MIPTNNPRARPLVVGVSSIFLGLLFAVSGAYAFSILRSGYVITGRVITMFSSSGRPLAPILIASLSFGGALLVIFGTWMIKGSFGSATRRRKSANIASITGVCLLAAVMVGSSFVAPTVASVSVGHPALVSQSTCSAMAYIVQTDGTYYYGFNGSTCNLQFGGPGNAGGTADKCLGRDKQRPECSALRRWADWRRGELHSWSIRSQ